MKVPLEDLEWALHELRRDPEPVQDLRLPGMSPNGKFCRSAYQTCSPCTLWAAVCPQLESIH